MAFSEDHVRATYFAHLPVKHALDTTRRSPSWKLFQGWRPRQKNRHAGLLGSGTRKGQALIKRLARQESGGSV